MARKAIDGVSVKEWRGHPYYRWRVTYPDGAKRKTKGFPKKSGIGGADEFADKMRDSVKTRGIEEEQISKAERQAVVAFR
ncbi:MAG: hypothetical protein P1U90_15325, partial [Akkermansiaceae bacterium]|nr:hypothetical protein [Akkermansiaceae bacterium]